MSSSSSSIPTTPLLAPLDLSLTDSSLQQRLALGVTSQTGAKGSLTRLASTLPNASSNKTIMRRDISLAQVEMRKLILQLQRTKQELHDLQQHAAANGITPEHYQVELQHVQRLRMQLATAQAQQSCKRDLEALAEFAIQKYPVSQTQLQLELDSINTDMHRAKQQLAQAQAEYNMRSSQVQHLLHGIMDLKQCLTEPVENLVVAGGDDDDDDDTNAQDDMDVEATEAGTDDALYTDLL